MLINQKVLSLSIIKKQNIMNNLKKQKTIEKKFEKLTYYEKQIIVSMIEEYIDGLLEEARVEGYDPSNWDSRIKDIRVIQKKLVNSGL